MVDVGGFLQDARRIFTVSKKPTFDEFMAMARVTTIGVIIIGVVGFIVIMIFTYFGIGL